MQGRDASRPRRRRNGLADDLRPIRKVPCPRMYPARMNVPATPAPSVLRSARTAPLDILRVNEHSLQRRSMEDLRRKLQRDPPMADDSVELLQGTLDLLILKTLSWGPTHGYGIARWIQEVTRDALRIEEGSLYPALHRLEKRGWIDASWGLSENNRRAKY